MPQGFADPYSGLARGLESGTRMGLAMRQQSQEEDKYEFMKQEQELAKLQATKERNNKRFESELDYHMKTKNLKGAFGVLGKMDKSSNGTTNFSSGVTEENIAEFYREGKEIDNVLDPDLKKQLTEEFSRKYSPIVGLEKHFEARPTGGAAQRAFKQITLVNPTTGEKRLMLPTFDPNTGTARLEEADIPDGWEISKETPEEKRAAELATIGKKKYAEVTGKTIAQRKSVAIEKGLDLSEGYASVKRGIQLLDQVPTGGFQNVALRAKQMFGVEAADEAELSNVLSKAVLSQLRETFGAAFTEKEGAKLERIEGSFGKSTEGNKRLLNQALKIIERASNRGIKAAEDTGDYEAADNIRENLAFDLAVEDEQLGAAAPPTGKTVVRTGTDKKTGRKVIQYSDESVEYAD
jgi:hypothetical protein